MLFFSNVHQYYNILLKKTNLCIIHYLINCKYFINKAFKIGPRIAAVNIIKCINLFPILRSLRKFFSIKSILVLTLSILVFKLSIL